MMDDKDKLKPVVFNPATGEDVECASFAEAVARMKELADPEYDESLDLSAHHLREELKSVLDQYPKAKPGRHSGDPKETARVRELKKRHTWQQVTEIMNEETGNHRTEGAYRYIAAKK